MSKILVCYYSKSGTTEMMAEEIIKGIEESDSKVIGKLMKVSEVDVGDIKEYSGLIIGSPTYYGLPSAEIKKFIDESIVHHGKLEWMVGGAFTSSANTAGGNETTLMAIIESLLIHGMIVKGMPKGDHYGPVVVGDPDEKELKQCKYYGRWMADMTEKVSRWNL
ncbi:MAG: flavodoxin domain-containing protein [Candidatus Saliniplasma sp.]